MQQQIIICGFHRSGTSMSAQALSRAGLFLGQSLIQADPSNPDGHFEDIETVNLHEKWLKQNATDWCHAGDLPKVKPGQARRELSPIIARFNQSSQPWAIKDPRASLFLQRWQDSLEQPFFVMAYRHYASCVNSLMRRQASELLLNPSTDDQSIRFWQQPETALRSWLLHNKALLAHYETHPQNCLLLSQEAQIQGESLVTHVNARFGLSLDEQAQTGIDSGKTLTVPLIKLPLVDTALQEELEWTWRRLQQLAIKPARNHAQVQWHGGRPCNREVSIDKLSSFWDDLGIAQSSMANAPVSNDRGNEIGLRLVTATAEQPQLTVTQHLENTNLNERAQVHAVLKQLSTSEKIAFLELATDAQPGDWFLNGLLGQRYVANHELAKAEACLSIATQEQDPAAWFHMGLMRLQQNRKADAIAAFESAVSIRMNPDHCVTLIRTCIDAGEWDKALQYCRAGIKHHKLDHRFASLGADVYLKQDKWQRALRFCLKNDINECDTTLLLKGFQILTAHGCSEEGLSLYRRATVRTLVNQADYRANALSVLKALPIQQSDRLQAQWINALRQLVEEKPSAVKYAEAA